MENLYEEKATSGSVKKARAGFISFWLFFGIIANVISASISIPQLNMLGNLGYIGMELAAQGVDLTPFTDSIVMPQAMLIIATILATIMIVFGYVLLLSWGKKGFYFCIIASLINVAATLICYPMIQEAYLSVGLLVDYSRVKYATVIGSFIPIIVLWLILQIKKNGVSCWSQLE